MNSIFVLVIGGLVLVIGVLLFFLVSATTTTTTTTTSIVETQQEQGTGPSGTATFVNRAWGDKSGFETAPFRTGDWVNVQIGYTYADKRNVAPVLAGGGVPVGYISAGTLEQNDPERVVFYKSLGIWDVLKGAVLTTKIMDEPFYDPTKLSSIVLPAYKKVIDTAAQSVKYLELDNIDFYPVNSEKPNATQDLIDAYVLALFDYANTKGLKIFQKNTMHLAAKLATHPAAAGLITESVGDDTNAGMCKQFQQGYGAVYGKGKPKPWFDFSYKKGTMCKDIGMDVIFMQGSEGTWKPL